MRQRGAGIVRRALLATGAATVGLLVVIAVAAPWIAPFDPLASVAPVTGEPGAPDRVYWFGTDALGRDVLSRVIYGARVSLTIGLAATAIAMIPGVGIGLCAGLAGRWIDNALMRLAEVALAIPTLLLAIALSAVLEPGFLSILVVIAVVSWAGTARTVRAEVLKVKQEDYVLAAHALGARTGRVLWHHLRPAVLPTVVAMAALATSGTVLLDAALSYLGLGVPVPTPSWGRMVSEAQPYYRSAPWLLLPPGAAIAATVAGFNFLGHGILLGLVAREG